MGLMKRILEQKIYGVPKGEEDLREYVKEMEKREKEGPDAEQKEEKEEKDDE